MQKRLVLIRHGQSEWNLKNLFTGWQDVDLTEQGRKEALQGGRALREEGFTFDVCHTSLLKRAIRTLWIVLDEMDLMWLPVQRSWRLNERHYGALTGMDKRKAVEEHGAEQVLLWRRSYDVRPPAMDPDDPRHPRHDRRYRNVDPALLPGAECLKDCRERVVPYFEEHVAPAMKAGERPLIVAHGNSLRALVMHLEDLSPEEIVKRNIPTGFPLVYEVDEDFKAVSSRYLGDPEAVRAAIEGVAKQTEKPS